MPKQRQIDVPAGGGYTVIRVTIPAHYMKIWKDGDRDIELNYKLKDDAFTQVYETDLTDAIELLGHGRSGLIGVPPNYNAADTPPEVAASPGDSGGGEIVLQVKASDDSNIAVNVYESENEL